MVYSAMEVFREIDPQLFDDCSQGYNEVQDSAGKRKQNRQKKWEKLQEQANRMKSGLGATACKSTVLSKAICETASTQHSQEWLDALKPHDECADTAKQTSVR